MTMSHNTDGSYSDDELIALFEETEDPVLTAPEIADELDITQQAAHSRLMRAYEHGELERKKTGARAVVWWLSGYDVASV